MKENEKLVDYIKDNKLDLDELVNNFSPYVKTIINNMAGEQLELEDKEEVFSDVFFILWKNRDTEIFALKYYIVGITKNLIREKLKKKKITYNLEDYENILQFTDENIEIFSEERDQISRIKNILKKFKPIEIKIIELFYYSSKSTKDIAKELNISEVNTRAKLSRIRKKIKRHLNGGKYENR